jgi:O-antigen/teichoic acid export membrane protein
LQSLFILLDFGMTPTLSRGMARSMGSGEDVTPVLDLLRSMELSLVSLGLLLAALVWALSGWLATSWLNARTLPIGTVAQTVAIMGLIAALRLVEGPYRGILVGLQRHVLLNALGAGFATLRGVGAIVVLAYVRPSIEVFFLWQLVSGILQLASFVACTYLVLPGGKRAGRFSVASLQNVRNFAGAMFAISIAGLILTNADKIMLSKLLTLHDYGYYTLAGLVASGLYTVIYPIRQTWSPRLNELHAAGNEAGFIKTYHRACELVTVAAGSIALFVIAFADVILRVWTRDASIADHTSGILRVLLLANLLNGLVNLPMEAQFAFRWTRLALIGELIGIAVILPLIIIVTPEFGALGAGWCLVALNVGYLAVSVTLMYRHILHDERWRWLFGDVLLPLSAAACCALTSRYLFSTTPSGSLVSWVTFVGGAMVTLLGAALAAPLIRMDSIRLLSRALPLSPR